MKSTAEKDNTPSNNVEQFNFGESTAPDEVFVNILQFCDRKTLTTINCTSCSASLAILSSSNILWKGYFEETAAKTKYSYVKRTIQRELEKTLENADNSYDTNYKRALLLIIRKNFEHIHRPQFDKRAQRLYENAKKAITLATQFLQPTPSPFKVILEGNHVGKSCLGLQAGFGTQIQLIEDEYIPTTFDPYVLQNDTNM